MKIVLLGAPGSGKGSQAALLKEKFNIPHISTGDIFRANIAQGTPLGKKVSEIIERGELVPDDITIELVKNRLTEQDCERGFILDGFPRTVPQAEALDKILSECGSAIDHVLNLTVSDEVVINRLAGRRVCSGCNEIYHINNMPAEGSDVCVKCGGRIVRRKDDEEETIRERLKNYYRLTAPLIDYYKKSGKLREIDGSGSIEDTLERVLPVLGVD